MVEKIFSGTPTMVGWLKVQTSASPYFFGSTTPDVNFSIVNSCQRAMVSSNVFTNPYSLFKSKDNNGGVFPFSQLFGSVGFVGPLIAGGMLVQRTLPLRRKAGVVYPIFALVAAGVATVSCNKVESIEKVGKLAEYMRELEKSKVLFKEYRNVFSDSSPEEIKKDLMNNPWSYVGLVENGTSEVEQVTSVVRKIRDLGVRLNLGVTSQYNIKIEESLELLRSGPVAKLHTVANAMQDSAFLSFLVSFKTDPAAMQALSMAVRTGTRKIQQLRRAIIQLGDPFVVSYSNHPVAEIYLMITLSNDVLKGPAQGEYTIGPEIEWVQAMLIELGYLTENDLDGIFGEKTEQAMKRFQHDLGIETFPTLMNFRKLDSFLLPTAERVTPWLRPGNQGPAVGVLQRRLIKTDWLEVGDDDEVFGQKTRTAITKLQRCRIENAQHPWRPSWGMVDPMTALGLNIDPQKFSSRIDCSYLKK